MTKQKVKTWLGSDSLLFDLTKRFREHNIAQMGGQLAFFILLSLFPFLIYVNALIGSLHISHGTVEELFAPVFPPQIVSFISTYISRLSENNSAGIISIGILISIFSASKSVRSLSIAMNTAYGVERPRGVIANFLFSVLFILCAGLMVLVLTVLIPASKALLLRIVEFFQLSSDFFAHIDFWRWCLIGGVLFLVLVVLYYFIPSRRMRFCGILPGVLFGMVAFSLLSIGFMIYAEYFFQGSILYGSISTVILLLLWLYFAGIILVLGAELNSALETRRCSVK